MSRPRLVVGLGNPLMGDDGVGWHIAEGLREHPGLPDDVEVVPGGTDLLRLQAELEERPRVVLVDAMVDAAPPGTLLRFEGDLRELDQRGGSVHQIPPVQALRLLRDLDSAIRHVPVTFLAVVVGGARLSHRLSAPVADRLDGLVDAVLAVLAEGTSADPRKLLAGEHLHDP